LPIVRRLVLLGSAGLLMALALALAGCGGGNSASPTPTRVTGASGVRGESITAQGGASTAEVVEAVFSTQVAQDKRATGLISNVFPFGVSDMYAVLVMKGVEPGTNINATWYQLNVPGAPPDGREVSSSGTTLTADQVVQGTTRVVLQLDPGGKFLPSGAWLVRVFDGEVLIKTMSFYVLRDPAQPEPTLIP
jgi:hypothetical protein